jgi:hypothetical protein
MEGNKKPAPGKGGIRAREKQKEKNMKKKRLLNYYNGKKCGKQAAFNQRGKPPVPQSPL